MMYGRTHDIQADGVTVWVHRDGETLARFGKFGIDIHRTIKEQQEGAGVCLLCSHVMTTAADWVVFVAAVKDVYSIEIGDEYRPTRLEAGVGRPRSAR